MVGLLVLAGLQIGLFAYTYFTREDEGERDPNEIRKGSTTVAKEGDSIPLVYGRCRVRTTNVVLYNHPESFQDYLRDAFRTVNGNKVYSVDCLVGVCVRPLSDAIVLFQRMWVGDSLIADTLVHNALTHVSFPDLWGGPGFGGGVAGTILAQDGRASQVESASVLGIMAINGPVVSTGTSYGAAPGVCMFFLTSFDIGESASMPGFSCEMVCWPDYTGVITSTVSGLTASTNGIDSGDANPAAALYQVLTAQWIGLGLDTAKINVASFNTAATTLDTEGNGFSMVFEKATPASKIIQEIIKQIDGVLYMDPETQELHLVLVREDYGAFPYAGLPEFDDSNVLKLMSYKETLFKDCYNQVRVEYEDRSAEYATKYAVSQNSSGATSSGRLKSMDLHFPGVKTGALANAIASREMKFFGTPQTSVTIKVNREGNTVRPGDVIKWSYRINQQTRITDMVLRVHQIALGDLDDGSLIFECTRDKYSNVAAVFTDPSRHWSDKYGIRPEAPGSFGAIEVPPNPFFEAGGSDGTAPDWGTVIVLVEPPTTPKGSRSFLDVQQASTATFVAASAKTHISTPMAKVSTDYTSTARYYDTADGLVISGLSDTTVLRASTEAEIRKGLSVISIGDEFVAYESYTDLGGGTYRLNNVWRGLFDTEAVDHLVDEPLFFVSAVDPVGIRVQKKFLDETPTQVRLKTLPAGQRSRGAATQVFADITPTRRDQRPPRPTQFTAYREGYDATGDHAEVVYAYNPSNITDVTISPFVGDDADNTTTDLGKVFSNDLLGAWVRRPVPLDRTNLVLRGDDNDLAPQAGDTTRYRLEGKRNVDDDYEVLTDRTFNGEDYITGTTAFLNLGEILPGPGVIRLPAINKSLSSAEELTSRTAEEITVDMVACRQLLINRKFRPYWDVKAGVPSLKGFGRGKKIPGNDYSSARGWRSVADFSPKYDTVKTGTGTVHAYLEQGSASEGHAMYCPNYAEEDAITYNSVTRWAEVEQFVPTPYLDTEGGSLWLSFYVAYKYPQPDNLYRVTVEVLDTDGNVLDTVTNTSGSTGDDPGALIGGPSDDGWLYQEYELTGMSAAATQIRIVLGMSSQVSGNWPPCAISNVALFMSRDISAQTLLNSGFADVTDGTSGWDHTTGTWTRVDVDYAAGRNLPGLEPLLSIDTRSSNDSVLLAPATGATGLIEQTVAVPAEFGAGDWARLEFWTAHTAAGADSIGAVLTALDGATATLATESSPQYSHANLDQWYPHELWLQLPATVANIKVGFASVQDSGAMDVVIGRSDLRFLKNDARKTEFNWLNTQQQARPATPGGFATVAGNLNVRPSSIFTMQDGVGVAPVDVVQGFTFDTPVGTADVDYSFGSPAHGLYTGADHTSVLALECSTIDGGVACTDPELLNPDGRSTGVYLQYRIVENALGNGVNVISQGGPHFSLAADTVCTQLWYNEDDHRLHFDLEVQSTDAGYFSKTCYLAGTPDDGCWHWLYASINLTTEVLSIWGDTSAGTTDSLTTMQAALLAAGEQLENTTDSIYIGRNDVVGGTYDDGPDKPFQISYMAVLRGIAAETFTRAMGQAMWTHGRDQNILDNGHEIVYTRTSRVAYPISANAVAMWSGSAGGGPVQVPIEYSEGMLGLGCFPAMTNLLTRANDLTQWTAVTATVVEASLRSERGLREMDLVDATVNGGHVYRDITGLTALTTYTFSAYAATDVGSHTATIEVTQNDLSTTLVSTPIAGVTPDPSRFMFTFTTQAGQTSTRVKLFGGTAATQTNTGFHGVMVTVGTLYGPVIYNDINQDGTTEALVAQTQLLTVAGNALTCPDEGSIYAKYLQAVQDTGDTRSLCEIHSATGSQDRRVMRILGTGVQDAAAYDGAGIAYHSTVGHAALTAGAEYERTVKWRRKANLASGAYTLEDQIIAPSLLTDSATGTTNTEGTGGHTRVYIGCRSTGSGQISGPLQTLRLFNGEVRDPNV